MRTIGIICLHISVIIMASEIARSAGLLYRHGSTIGLIVFCIGIVVSLVLVGALLARNRTRPPWLMRKTDTAVWLIKTLLYTVIVGLLGWYLYACSLIGTMTGLDYNPTITIVLMAVGGFSFIGGDLIATAQIKEDC